MKIDAEKYTRALEFLEERHKKQQALMNEAIRIIKYEAKRMNAECPETVLRFSEHTLKWMAQLMNGATLILNIDSLRRMIESMIDS